MTIHSEVLWGEMRNFVRIRGGGEGRDIYRAGKGHDDCVMAAGIALVIGDDESMGVRHTVEVDKPDRKRMLQLALEQSILNMHTDGNEPRKIYIGGMDKLKQEFKGFK
jgi:hypothetical protein